jgi:cysteine-rich repeat protein
MRARGGLLIGVLALSCSGKSGVLVSAAWDSAITVDALEVQTTIGTAAPTSQTLTAPGGSGPMVSPFRVLVTSPADRPLQVYVLAHQGPEVVATGRLSATPGGTEILEIALHLQPTAGPRCGDGTVDPGEACDDGNREDRDGCTDACACSRCGDGILQVFPGAANGSCAASAIEECDDGNNVDGDGCSSTCKRE